ncbi:class I SAM-dependent methyltransferase [Lutimaribacter marinistellae]|uniref:Class I SAM-dependent methyltransferase n=1 Tax=Lutimaribacter marinistellae TaxID=1820329 RepID=A0ABV7TFV6_9RHOB
MSLRLSLALDAGLDLPGAVSVLLPTPEHDLSGLTGPVRVVQPFKPHHDHFAALGLECSPKMAVAQGDVVLFLPRAKARARDLVARAARGGGTVVVDGAKTDGIDSLLKDIRKRVPVEGPISKAHGKIFWFRADAESFADWIAPETFEIAGFHLAPGVFSADGIDPASALLSEALPDRLGRHVVDLGAGWGYLSAQILGKPGVERVDLVEADHVALDCARLNVADTRARFHWADACTWRSDEPANTVVMNPPFHAGRAADPGIGQGFIQTAARSLAPGGALWMVANRHLPYEAELQSLFARVEEVGGDNRFKILHAARPSRPRR